MKAFLSKIAEVRLGFPFRTRLEADEGGTTFVVQMKDIADTEVVCGDGLLKTTVDDKSGGYSLQVGDLIFKSRGMRNTAALVAAPMPSTVVAAPMVVIRVSSDAVLPGYLQWFINHPATQRKMEAMPTSSTGRMIGLAELRQFEVDVPTLEIQKRIQTVHEMQVKERELNNEATRLRELLVERILMDCAMRGSEESG